MSTLPKNNRDKDGKFVQGKSGNPYGRPVGAKNRITKAKQDLELLMRENVLHVKDIKAVWNMLIEEAKGGNINAAKIVLDKTLSTIRNDEDAGGEENRIVIKIDNLTLPDLASKVIEGEIVTEDENGKAIS